MMNKILRFSFLLFLLSACSKDITTIEVIRKPQIQFTADSVTWAYDNYNFLAPSKVVEYPADPTLSGRLYNRYTLQATGTDSKGRNLQLILIFDAVDNMQLAGTYKKSYSATKGLNDVQIFNLNSNSLASYSLCDTAFSMLTIKKQSVDEKLIAGSFQARLCNVRDTTQKITITNGLINDINYRY